MMYEFKTENDSTGEYKFEIIHDDGDESKAMIWNRKKPGQIVHLPKPGVVPHAPGIMFMERGKKDNVIDLSDSDIVSYKKRKMKGGREKITIVRKVPEDGNVKEEKEEIIISDVGENAVWHSKAPGKVHAVQVTKEMDGKVKVIKEGNKIIRITENKKDGEEQVEVKVEVETEKENN